MWFLGHSGQKKKKSRRSIIGTVKILRIDPIEIILGEDEEEKKTQHVVRTSFYSILFYLFIIF